MNQPAADKSPLHAGLQSRLEIDTLYTPLDEALAQLRERRADETLHASVAEFHRPLPPTFLPSEPCAFLFRHIVTPSRELELFGATAKQVGLPPFCLEYTEDTFIARNREKYLLCRPMFEVRPGHFRGLRMMRFGEMSGWKLADLRLACGITLPEFHHSLLGTFLPEFDRCRYDCSGWFSAVSRERHFYLRYLTLFIRDGILFENFLAADVEELRFARERVVPSFIRAVEMFGVRPLIVPLLPRETEGEDHWRCHDGALYAHAVNLLRQRHAADS